MLCANLSGIGYSGTSLGTLVLPLVYTLLIEEYTVRGTLLLAGNNLPKKKKGIRSTICQIISMSSVN